MTKTDLITNIIDYIERSYSADDMTDELYDEMTNFLHTKYIDARVEERIEDENQYEKVRKFYYDIVKNFLSNNADEGLIPYYDNTEKMEYKLVFDGKVNETMKVVLLIANADSNIIDDYVIVDDFLPIRDKIEVIVSMIMFDKYC